ncbi:hypothetical protein A0H81_11666 [Grifola frondosa]|uniref:Uncharacterized protein n=1 Tax=Grifola frondosa TaxID=5627 RepID=A0A1C7LWF0_GRIFR|nr:hypothetical protein A0H81_11666 [Grifola frondosa]
MKEYNGQGDFVQVDIFKYMNSLHCKDNQDPHPVLIMLEKLAMEYATASGILADEQYKALIIGCLPKSF